MKTNISNEDMIYNLEGAIDDIQSFTQDCLNQLENGKELDEMQAGYVHKLTGQTADKFESTDDLIYELEETLNDFVPKFQDCLNQLENGKELDDVQSEFLKNNAKFL